MNKAVVELGELFNKENIIMYFISLLAFLFTFILVIIVTVGSLYKNNIQDYEERINTIIKTEGKDINLMCNVISCEKAIMVIGDNDYVYTNVSGILRPTNAEPKIDLIYDDFLNHDFKTIIFREDVVFIINDTKYFINILKLSIVISILCFFVFTILYILRSLTELRAKSLEKKSLLDTLTKRLQLDLVESLKHEVGVPIAIIRDTTTDLFATLYPCKNTPDSVCKFNPDSPDRCADCSSDYFNREIDKTAKTYYDDITFAIERIVSVLDIISGNKAIKYSNGSISLYKILNNIIDTNNRFLVRKVTVGYENMDILKKYACGTGLENGDMLQVLHAIVNNAIEAHATHIKFYAKENNNGYLSIFVDDNGVGVRDHKGRVLHNTDIFNYGYSTKLDEKWDSKLKVLVYTFLDKLGIKINKFITYRGAGLSVTKGILNRSNGDIELYHTSDKGSIFKVTIPIKLRRDK